MTRHTSQQIEEAARRFEKWADELDPAAARIEDLSDLRAIAEADDALRRQQARLTEQVAVARGRGRSWGIIGTILGVSRQAARQRFGGKVGR
jgi:hypothetical protein